jgi:methyl acetate hydrolase
MHGVSTGMNQLTRRRFGRIALAGAAATRLRGASRIDDVLREGRDRHGIPCVVAMVCDARSILYAGAFGRRDGQSDANVALDSIFRIASMTKPVTSAAAMQLVEQGKVSLDQPAAQYLPELAQLQVLTGFSGGQPMLRPPARPITLRHLLSHTSGLAYPTWHERMFRYNQIRTVPPGAVAPPVPLMFDPGANWQYGYSMDWVGRLVETVSGLSLEQYFQRNIFAPLGMKDTSFILPPEKFERLVGTFNRQPGGTVQGAPRLQPQTPQAFNGGGGLYSTAADYVRFIQMFLNYGMAGVAREVLKARSIDAMARNQIGSLTAGRMKSFQPDLSADVNMPGKWGLGFLIHPTRAGGMRSAGSLSWAGIFNTFFWIDPERRIGAVLLMQYLPFVDPPAVALLGEFERAVYAWL